MKHNSNEISFYVDCLIVEAIAVDPILIKKAGVGSFIFSAMKSMKDYIESRIDPNDKIGSVINLLAPGKIFVLSSAIGHPWIGVLLALATSVFDINVAKILREIYNGVKSLVIGGKKTTSAKVDQVVSNAVSSNYIPATKNDEIAAESKIASFNQKMMDARLVKLAMERHSSGIEKNASIWGTIGFGALKLKIIGALKTIFSWLWKILLASAGAMVAGDITSRVFGIGGKRTSPTDYTSSLKREPSIQMKVSKQTRFPENNSYGNAKYNGSNDVRWSEAYVNNKGGIKSMIIQFAKEVYTGLNGLENVISSTAGFRVIIDKIYWYNYSTAGSKMVFIPSYFKTKKQIVDLFIDDVAKKAPKSGK